MRTPLALVLAVVLIPSLGLAGIAQAQAQPLSVSPVPVWGIVLGTIIIAGLLYLIVHGPDGGYYRYPYYGEYYQYYYRPWYQPYDGYYPMAAPLILVAPVVVGTVLGIVAVNNLEYIVSRDAYGHYYRYPYYGPYRQVYYRPTYHVYAGTYAAEATFRAAPVRQGDPRWDNDKRILAPVNQRPQPGTQPRPAYQQPQRQYQPQQRPTYQQPQRQYQPQQRPTYQQPQRQYQQTPRQPNSGPGGGRTGPGGRPQQQCGGPQQPPCPDNNQHP